MAEKKSKLGQRAVLIILLALPVSVYVGSVILSGELNFKSIEVIGPREVVANSDGSFDTTYYTVPDFSFVNQHGDTITKADMEGKIYVASFFFTQCPTICKPMNFHLKQVHDRMVAFEDVMYLSHSIDTEHDTVEALYQYSRDLGVANSKRWMFVTSNKEEVFAMADSYFLPANTDSTRTDHAGYYHSAQVVLVDWDGRIRSRRDDNGNIIGAYEISEPKDIDPLIDDLRVLTKEYRKVKMER